MPNIRSQLALATIAIFIALVWCVILPWLAQHPVVEQRLKFLDDQKIDPSAMYYTELEVMDDILNRLEGRVSASKPEAE